MTDSASIRIASTFTAEPLAESLVFWFEEWGLSPAIEFAPYGQIFQSLIDPLSLLRSGRRGLNVLLVRLEDWGAGCLDGSAQELRRTVEVNTQHFLDALAGAIASTRVPHLVVVCPASPRFLARAGGAETQEAALAAVRAANLPGLQVADENAVFSRYPVEMFDDPDGEQLAHIPYTAEFFTALGTFVFRHFEAMRRTPRKVIVLDCDETLWGGVCGEVGPGGVEVDPARVWFQEFLISQHDSGKMLTMCSKNVEEDVLSVFRERTDMPLHLDHFVSWEINWQPKSQNLRKLAQDLSLGVDSFVFIDDNPRECAEVAASLPSVAVLQLPRDSSEIPDFISHCWILDGLPSTEEDRKRNTYYKVESERRRLQQAAPSLDEFLASLDLRVQITPAGPATMKRLAQLTTRTNQFNFTTIRRSEAELQAMLTAGWECVAIEVQDRFGDYGIVGNVIYRAGAQDIEVETFLMSCRVLGRRVELQILAFLKQKAVDYGKAGVVIRFVPTPKNRPAQMFLESIGMPDPKGHEVLFPLPERCDPAPLPSDNPIPAGVEDSGSEPPVPSDTICRVAREFRSIDEISAAMRRKSGTEGEIPVAAVGSPLEARIAEIWCEVLGRKEIDREADFFDLGGDSLQATRVVSRVRQSFGANLMLDSFFEARTISGLAVAVLQSLTEQVG